MSPPKLPFISKRDIQRIVRDLPAKMAEQKKDEEDRRCLRGKYTPEHGRCRVCPGHVVADVAFPHSDLIGGPPRRAYVKRWHCTDCGLVYAFCPPPREP